MTILQIEPTTRCTLKCPACSRTIFAEKFNRAYPHYDIDYEILYQFLDCESGRKIDTLNLCGDHGDPIYYPDLFPLIDRFRSSKNFQIVTNGSYRDQKFWESLCSKLTDQDTIIFSIDGLEDTNHLYRVNSDWRSIELGLDTAAKYPVKIHIESNIFSFNYNQLDKLQAFAESKGATWVAKKTSRFGRDDLVPPEQYINTDALYRDQYSDPTAPVKVVPDCVNRIRNSVSAQHYFWPCGWISSPFTLYKSRLWKDREQWSIKNKTLDDILTGSLASWIKSIEDDQVNCDIICKMRCKENQLPRVNYTQS